jgi:hypothetical protein
VLVPEVPFDDEDGPQQAALRYRSRYEVELTTVEPLARQSWTFTTLARDAQLEHTCGHTIDPVHATLALADQGDAAATISLTHRRHRIGFAPGRTDGFVRLRVPGSGTYRYTLYLSQRLDALVTRESDGARMSEVVEAVPPACDRLTTRVGVTLYGSESYWVRLATGALSGAAFELYLERSGGAVVRDGGVCRTSGPCRADDECCDYCHDQDHCH